MKPLDRGACFAADGISVNNVLGFPGLFKGCLESGAKQFTDKMLIAAAQAIHEQAPDGQLVPDPLSREVHEKVASAFKKNIWENKWIFTCLWSNSELTREGSDFYDADGYII